MRLTQIIEALLFASDAPLTAADLARIDERLDEDTVTAVIEELRSEYDLSERSFQVYEVAGGYQILTRPEFVAVLERYDTVPQSARLSTPALEVLAIIAYRQPLGRIEVEEIRGVQSAAVLRTLQDRGLIEPVGRSEALGRPLLYGTTSRFLDHFGFRSLEDLPRPDELPVVLRTRQVVAEATDQASAPAGEEEAAQEAREAHAGSEDGASSETAGAADAPAPEAAAAGEAPEGNEAAATVVASEAPEPAGEAGPAAEPVRTAAVAEELVAEADPDLAPEPPGATGEDASGQGGQTRAGEDEEAEAAAVREG